MEIACTFKNAQMELASTGFKMVAPTLQGLQQFNESRIDLSDFSHDAFIFIRNRVHLLFTKYPSIKEINDIINLASFLNISSSNLFNILPKFDINYENAFQYISTIPHLKSGAYPDLVNNISFEITNSRICVKFLLYDCKILYSMNRIMHKSQMYRYNYNTKRVITCMCNYCKYLRHLRSICLKQRALQNKSPK